MTQQPETPNDGEKLKVTILEKPPGRAKPAAAPAKRVRRTPVRSQPKEPDFDSEEEDSLDDVSVVNDTVKPAQRTVVEKPDRTSDKSVPKGGAPSVDEWQDFIGRIVLRTLFDGYMTLMLRDIELSEQEERYLHLSKQDLKEMSAPLAGFASKNRTLRKHGRSIVSAADSWESVVAISIWLRRVNRVARRHRKELAQMSQQRNAEKAAHRAAHNNARNAQAAPPVPQPTPANVGPQPNGNGGLINGSTGSDEVNGSRPVVRRADTWRPPHPDLTVNPGSG